MSLHGRHSAKGTAQFSPAAAPSPSPDQEAPEAPKTPKAKEESGLGFLRELPILVLVAFAIAIIIKTFVVQAFYIPSESMQNTLLVNDRVLVSKFIYRFKDPRPGGLSTQLNLRLTYTGVVVHGKRKRVKVTKKVCTTKTVTGPVTFVTPAVRR